MAAMDIKTATDVTLRKPVTVSVHAFRRDQRDSMLEDGRITFEVGTRVVQLDASPAFVVALLSAALEAPEHGLVDGD